MDWIQNEKLSQKWQPEAVFLLMKKKTKELGFQVEESNIHWSNHSLHSLVDRFFWRTYYSDENKDRVPFYMSI